MLHPIRTAIESLQRKGKCPRLQVDVTHEDAVCPDFVRDKWQQRLVIDLDPSYPLDLAFTEVGVEADLSFGGHVARCVFPWTAIYVVADRSTGQGKVFQEHIPAALRHQPTPELDPELTEVRDDKAGKGRRRRKRRRPPAESAPPTPPEAKPEPEAEPEPEPEETDATSRRAAFKVIDGGA